MELDTQILEIFLILRNRSNNNFLVGGCVRDHLMGIDPHDYDIVTDIHMDVLEKDFIEAGWKVKDTGKEFLILNVIKNGNEYEIANFRKDGNYSDMRRPDSVDIGTLEDDAFRRDFTVNALFYEPFSGEILDPTNKGLKDIKSKTLRFVGRAKDRLAEDSLRSLRFYRFLSKGFTPNPKCLRAVRTNFNENMVNMTPERVRMEIEKMVL